MNHPVVFSQVIRLASVTCLLVLSCVACAQTADVAPEERVYRVSSWKDLHVAHKGLIGRLDGVVAGAFTEKVGELFAENWQLLDEYAQVSTLDKRFATDVMAALNEAIPATQAAKIVSNARTRCPARHSVICKQITSALVPAGT